MSSDTAAGTVALVAPVTTWQAYNAWGGYSLYQGPAGDRRSWAVSFDRPYNGATGANDYRTAALPIVVRAEELGIPLSYFTNVDLHRQPALLDGARGYVSLGHDEYWTTTMRDAVTKARDAGTNLAFLGANTMYWRIRLAARATGPARVVVGYRDDAHLDPLREERPVEATSRFRDAPAAAAGARADRHAVRVLPRRRRLRRGLARDGGASPAPASGTATGRRAWSVRRRTASTPTGDSPRPLQVLSHTPYDCRGATTSAQSVYYTTRSGSGVFTAGTLRWGCALIDACERPLGDRTRRFVRIVTGNVLREFATGPVGRSHPARENLDEFDLPVHNSVSAS